MLLPTVATMAANPTLRPEGEPKLSTETEFTRATAAWKGRRVHSARGKRGVWAPREHSPLGRAAPRGQLFAQRTTAR
jgi:hypothetical protein